MKLDRYYVRNFRRLEDVEIHLDSHETILVGPNNSGKTSVAMIFRLFVSQSKNFRIYDFSAPLLKIIDEFGEQKVDSKLQLPAIELDLWFSVDPEEEYGSIASFLPSVSVAYTEIGVRLAYSVTDSKEVLNSYNAAHPEKDKTLSAFLSNESNINKFFSLKYYKLENAQVPFKQENTKSHPIDKDAGKTSLHQLLRVDFLEAQRNIDDNDAARSNRLSMAFSDFYKFNLEKQENNAEAIAVIDKNNASLTGHYEKQFKDLVDTINEVGFPSSNDRDLKIISTLQPETALKGNTTLLYFDKETAHELPEAYNGLGFKNLIYMAIQVCHFHKRWLAIEKNRPLCQLIFIEEPEAHLHAQVQQVFIRQIRKITEKTAKDSGEEAKLPQLLISTHSSHLLQEAEFTAVRYFQRIGTKYSGDKAKKTATNVLNLAKFDPSATDPDNIKFLKKFLKLNHCDLFFADAAILIEGSVERIMLPSIIAQHAQELKPVYFTTLEVGGSYSYRLFPLLDFIGLPSLVVSDLDAVDPKKHRAACRADTDGAVTCNKTLSEFFKVSGVRELLALAEDKFIDKEKNRIIAFQKPVAVTEYGKDIYMTPRTLEESFIYENIAKVRSKKLETFVDLNATLHFENDYTNVFETVKNKNYEKVEFALNQVLTEEAWNAPEYIVQGLKNLGKLLGLVDVSVKEKK